jgi:hypothetical protein
MAKSRIVVSWSLATVAFSAIAMGFRANEPSAVPSSATAKAGAAASAEAGVPLRRSEASVTPAEFQIERRAHAAGPRAPLGVTDGTELQRARLTRGEPGLPVSLGSTPVARSRVTPGALPPPSQPGLPAAPEHDPASHSGS